MGRLQEGSDAMGDEKREGGAPKPAPRMEMRMEQDPEETEVIDGTEVYLRKETRSLFAFDDVKIRLLTKAGPPLASGVRRVWAAFFQVVAPGLNKLFVKSVRIEAAGVEFNYARPGEFDLPASLEVGPRGILQKTVPDIFPIEIISREVVGSRSCPY
jgi:hypothetical protein